ncbi:HPP family protein [bacterium]|nr:HPP family protein [bacterium]
MGLLDPKFKQNFWSYLWQCALASFFMFIVLYFVDVITYPALLAVLGSTFFIIFTLPHSYASKPRPLIGGYIISTIVGVVFCFISKLPQMQIDFLTKSFEVEICGALAIGFAIFFMLIFDSEHPPAAGLALALIINPWDYLTIIFLLCIIILLAMIKTWLKPVMKDLL